MLLTSKKVGGFVLKGKYEKARELYLKALSQEYPYSGAIENLISLYLNEGNTKMAKRWITMFYPYDEATIDVLIKNYLEENKKQ